MLGEVGARRKQRLVVVGLSQGRKSRRYSRGNVDGVQLQDLVRASKIFFCKCAVS